MNEELKKLYKILEKISSLILGSDPQSRKEYTHLKKKVVEKIKTLENELKQNNKNGIIF